MNDEIELKPCLFCGSDLIEIAEAFGDNWAACSNCNASTAMKSNPVDAAKLWNERANA